MNIICLKFILSRQYFNRPIFIVFHARKVEKRYEEKFWGKFLRIFVDFDEILPKFWILIAVGCQKLGSGGVRVSSPQFQVGFGCPKMSGYPSGFRVPYYITNRESSFIRMTNSPIIEILIINRGFILRPLSFVGWPDYTSILVYHRYWLKCDKNNYRRSLIIGMTK